ncbi:uncharacterized protein LOC144994590 [Oryzias latipes]
MRLLQDFVIFFLTMMPIIISSKSCSQPKPSCWCALTLSLKNLEKAEKSYIHDMCEKACEGHPHKKNHPEPLEGLTFPLGNTTDEIQSSVCAINDYLKNHLPPIFKNLHANYSKILRNIQEFGKQLEDVAREHLKIDNQQPCEREVPALDCYSMKHYGYRIISFTRKWTKSFLHTELCSS